MMIKILYLDTYEHCNLLGVVPDFRDFQCEFDGIKHYKKCGGFFKAYDIVISTIYLSSLSNYLICKIKQSGVCTVFLSDGIYDLANSCRNPRHLRLKRKLYEYLPHDYFFSVGLSPIYYGTSNLKSYLPARIISMNKKIPIPNSKQILITTANTAYFNVEERDRLLNLMLGVMAVLRDRDIQFSVRIFDDFLLNKLNDNYRIVNDIDRDFEECLKDYSHVITTPSSISVTAMYHQRPTAQFIYRYESPSVSSAWNIPSEVVFEEMLSSFINNDKIMMRFQEKSVSEYSDVNTLDDLLLGIDLNANEKYEYVFKNLEIERILNSPLNFNFEYFLRKVYEKIKKSTYIKKIKNILNV